MAEFITTPVGSIIWTVSALVFFGVIWVGLDMLIDFLGHGRNKE